MDSDSHSPFDLRPDRFRYQRSRLASVGAPLRERYGYRRHDLSAPPTLEREQ